MRHGIFSRNPWNTNAIYFGVSLARWSHRIGPIKIPMPFPSDPDSPLYQYSPATPFARSLDPKALDWWPLPIQSFSFVYLRLQPRWVPKQFVYGQWLGCVSLHTENDWPLLELFYVCIVHAIRHELCRFWWMALKKWSALCCVSVRFIICLHKKANVLNRKKERNKININIYVREIVMLSCLLKNHR